MKKIFKYQLKWASETKVEMPVGCKILSVQPQHEFICIWAEVDESAKLETRIFQIFVTGEVIPNIFDPTTHKRTYLNTCVCSGGNLVWHVYEFSPI